MMYHLSRLSCEGKTRCESAMQSLRLARCSFEALSVFNRASLYRFKSPLRNYNANL